MNATCGMFYRLGRPIAAIKVRAVLAGAALLVASGLLHAETVDVKYRGPVDLAKFECTGELDSGVVKRVCYKSVPKS